MEKGTLEEEWKEFPAFVSLLIGRVCFFVDFTIVMRLMLAAKVVLLELLWDIYKSLRDAKNGQFVKLLF